jgi:hypothetical protein
MERLVGSKMTRYFGKVPSGFGLFYTYPIPRRTVKRREERQWRRDEQNSEK